jgi:hypothetical protein
MYLLFIWGGTYGFVCGEIHNEISRFQGPPLQTGREMDFPHPNSYFQPHIKNRNIGNFMDKIFQNPFRDGLMCVCGDEI